jgi:hypothetical protein
MKLGIFYCCATVTATEICLLIKNLCKLSCIYVLVGPVGFELLKRAIGSFFFAICCKTFSSWSFCDCLTVFRNKRIIALARALQLLLSPQESARCFPISSVVLLRNATLPQAPLAWLAVFQVLLLRSIFIKLTTMI